MSDVAAHGKACLYLRTPGKVVTGWPSRPGLLVRGSAWSHRAQPRSRALNTVPPCVQLSRLVPQWVVDGADNTPSRFLQSAHSPSSWSAPTWAPGKSVVVPKPLLYSPPGTFPPKGQGPSLGPGPPQTWSTENYEAKGLV